MCDPQETPSHQAMHEHTCGGALAPLPRNFLMKKLKNKESKGFAWYPTAGLQHKHIAILLFVRRPVFLNFKDQQLKKNGNRDGVGHE